MDEMKIDANDMVRKLREALHEETEGLTREELIAFYDRKAAEFEAMDAADQKTSEGGRSAA
jgi:hypothetical protein